ncbi:unnamed protein product [Sphenostylis stenocarpa]|uniref:Leucine-rich repeat-containing N-terminal plant-type domain-containing protein n=1 Tax=Sphenostylis stenocarpa TaxID=92480 RepID=A0AA86SPL7_9FABA|nr:unnamed protein product [Sphenostylis stenocarpa]
MILSLYWLFLCNHEFVVSGHCLDDQRPLLLQFKSNLTFKDMADRSSSSLNSWNSSTDCCMWMGVVCDGEGHVIGLDLVAESISGVLDNSSSVFSLQHLQNLNLAENFFTGPMASFGMAKNLTNLDLSHNALSGVIPSSHFQGLHNLVYIDLRDNSFTGSIPSSLFTLPLLQEIQLSHNQFSHLDEFINVSSSVLKLLDLSSNNLSGSFPTFIFQLNTLSIFRISSNKFNGSVQLNKLSMLKNLTELDLSYNNLSVNLNVTDVDTSFFPRTRTLKLASCNLKTFPRFLRNMSTLIHLDLSDNQIRGMVPKWIQKLNYLNISHNLLTDFEPRLHNDSSNLSLLDLHYNNFQGPIPVFPARYLDYSCNKFSTFIPSDIGNYLSETFFLSLSNNNLHGNIPNSLCKASRLAVLDLSINEISGSIPLCLMKMSDTLEVLNLKNNKLSGQIPDTGPASCGLWTLNLHGNLLDGPIPKSLAFCSKLEVLDLGSNQIMGGFPCFLKKVSILVLRNNKFQGSLACLKVWQVLQVVDIAFNNFSGELPGKYFTTWKRNITDKKNEVGSKIIEKRIEFSDLYYEDSVTVINKGLQMELVKILRIFTSIDFSSNHFEGPIPDKLMEFKELYALNLSNNCLSGKIPSSIDNLIQLESLDLSKNSLSGEIPIQLANLSFLSYLNLSFNHLVGKIPTGTQLQSFPASSFEGNDGLYGPPLIEKQKLLEPECRRLVCIINWNFITFELGLIFGLGIVIGPLLFWKQWRVWYCQLLNRILCLIFPQLYLQYVTDRGQTYAILSWWY